MFVNIQSGCWGPRLWMRQTENHKSYCMLTCKSEQLQIEFVVFSAEALNHSNDNLWHCFGLLSVSMVFGIPTIKRDKVSYLYRTLHSLIDGLNEEEREDCLIIVFVAEVWLMLLLLLFGPSPTLTKHILWSKTFQQWPSHLFVHLGLRVSSFHQWQCVMI